MNKIYRLVRNTSTGEWTVASELARSHGKSGAAGKVMLALGAVLGVSSFGMAGMAQAACGVNAAGTYASLACAPVSGDAELTTQADTFIINPTVDGIRVISTDGNATANIAGTTITKPAGSSYGININTSAMGKQANLNLSGTNSISLTGSGVDTGALAYSRNGDAHINISGTLDIINTRNGRLFDGLEAEGWGANATVTHQGDGTITTHGGNAILINGLGATTNATADIGSDVQLMVDNTVSGAGGYENSGIKVNTQNGTATAKSAATIQTMGDKARGIHALSSGTGNVVVDNAGDISTNGDASHAIEANTTTGDITITNSGTLTTNGTNSLGIKAVSTAGGAVTIDSTGDVSSLGAPSSAGAHAILGQIGNTGGTGGGAKDLTITASGTLKTNGYDSSGIRGTIWGGASTGDVNITYSGPGIETTGNSSRAIMGYSQGSGDITIAATGNGTIHTTNINAAALVGYHAGSGKVDISNSMALNTEGGERSHGIWANTAAGDLTVNNTGDITTVGTNSQGINAVSTTGAISITNSGTIDTDGMSSRGIAAVSTSGDIKIDSSGDITTRYAGAVDDTGSEIGIYAVTGNAGNITIDASGALDTNGVHSHGIFAITSGSGDIAINYSGPSVITRGENGDGIRGDATGSGNVSIVTRGTGTVKTVDAAGGAAFGVIAQTQQGRIDIDNTLSIETHSNTSSSIYARSSAGGDIGIKNSGNIVTQGANSQGINATATVADITIDNSGDIATAGMGSMGIRAVGEGAVKITSTGDITTTATGSVAGGNPNEQTHAILGLTTGNGDVVINAGGALETHGFDSTGVRGYSTGTGTVDLNYNGPSINVYGDDGDGIYAQNTSTGDVKITTEGNGTIETRGGGTAAGNYAYGIVGLSGSGNVDIANTMAIKTGLSGNSSGIYAYSSAGGGVTVANDGAIATASASTNSFGILAQANGAGDIAISNSGDITIAGAANAIRAEHADTAGSGNILVASSGDITVNGAVNSSAIYAMVAGSGNATVKMDGGALENNSTSANAHGLEAQARGTGDSMVNLNAGSVTTNGGLGIAAWNNGTGTGNSTVVTVGGTAITALGTGSNASGIQARGGSAALGTKVLVDSRSVITANAVGIDAASSGTAGGAVTVIQTGGSITSGGIGIRARSAGIVDVINSGSIHTTGNGVAHGILAQSTADGDVTVNSSGTLIIDGAGDQGIHAQSVGGDAKVVASGDITTNDTSLALDGDVRTHGIFAATDGAAGKVASIVYDDAAGSVTVKGSSNSDYDMVSALRAETSGGADAVVTVKNAGSINALGNDTAGIDVRGVADTLGELTPTTGNLKVEFLSGTINAGTVDSVNADGIHAINYGSGNVDVLSLGDINVKGNAETAYGGTWGSEAIYADAVAGNVTVKAGGNINVTGTTFNHSAGIVAVTHGGGTASITFDDAAGSVSTVAGAAPAIKAAALGGGEAIVAVDAGKISASGESSNAVEVISPDTQTVTVAAAGELNGGWAGGAAIALQKQLADATPVATVTNAGSIGALSDRAIATDFIDGSTLDIANQGSGAITGYLTLGDGANTLDNSGTWNLRNLSDSDGDGARDTLAVAVSDFGTGTSNTVSNSGTLNLLGGSAANVDMSGLFDTGYTANTLASGGAVQGHILGVSRFSNSGVIDMGDANSAVGDVLLVSGSRTAGVSGNGSYVSDGGLLKIDTVLNEGGANSQSDMLVVDGVELGSGATAINVKNVGGTGALTVDDGIEVVRVLDGGDRSAADAFVLDGRAVAGVYEYTLQQGGKADPANGNWYLRNTAPVNPPVDPESPVDPDPTPIYRPEPFAYLANQIAANGMFQHTLHDRLGEPNYAERTRGDESNTNGWVRVQGHQLDTRTAEQIGADIDTWMVQGGVELGRWSTGDSRFHLGGMVGTGRSTTRVDSEITGHKAIGRVQGNSLGVYGTWYANAAEPTGLYVDSWLQYGRYDNDVNGDYQVKESYTSSNLAFSLEAGYAWQLRDNGRSALYIEPQAQAIFSDYSSDRFTETSGMEVRAGGDAEVLTRLGARLYGHTTNAKHNKVQPFVEANWWHAAQEASMRFDGQELDRVLPRDRYEVKLGAEVELGGNWTGWGHLGYQQGKQDYRNLDGLIGIKRVW